jgi:hypothetical protein
MSEGPQQTRFYELAGEAAQARLGELAGRLRHAGARTRVLESRDQEGLYLLVAEAERFPELTPPDGCRVWTFASVGP